MATPPLPVNPPAPSPFTDRFGQLTIPARSFLMFLRTRAETNASGTVTSVGLTMPTEFSVLGSPVTSSGTLAVTKTNQSANTVWAGPASGAAGAPAFRGLTTADMPAGTGTVTSVALAMPAEFAVAGSPLTSSGTLTVTKANQAANLVYAGPASGSAVPAFRSLVQADMPSGIAPQVNSDWNATSGVAMILNKPVLTGGTAWSALTNPTANLALTMGANTSVFTYSAGTGSSDLFKITDSANNTGTGALLSILRASTSTMIPLRLKQLANADSQPLLQAENSSAAVTLGLYCADIAGFGTARIDAGGAPFLLTRGAANTLLQFSDSGSSKWLCTINTNFDGLTASEIGLTINQTHSFGGSSTAALLSVQNQGTRVFDVQRATAVVKAGASLLVESGAATSITVNGSVDMQTHKVVNLANGTNPTDAVNLSQLQAAGAGTVTSVGLTAPVEFTVAGSPITSSGTLALAKTSQSANTVWAAPSGAAGVPTFRTLVQADMPSGIAPQVQSDWTASSGLAQILHQPPIAYDGSSLVTVGANLTVTGGTFTTQSGSNTIALNPLGTSASSGYALRASTGGNIWFDQNPVQFSNNAVTFNQPQSLIFGSNYQSYSPTLSGSSGTVTMGTNYLYWWIRIGPLIHFQFNISVTVAGGPITSINVSLPVNMYGTGTGYTHFACITSAANWQSVVTTVQVGVGQITIYSGSVSGSSFPNGTVDIRCNGTYRCA